MSLVTADFSFNYYVDSFSVGNVDISSGGLSLINASDRFYFPAGILTGTDNIHVTITNDSLSAEIDVYHVAFNPMTEGWAVYYHYLSGDTLFPASSSPTTMTSVSEIFAVIHLSDDVIISDSINVIYVYPAIHLTDSVIVNDNLTLDFSVIHLTDIVKVNDVANVAFPLIHLVDFSVVNDTLNLIDLAPTAVAFSIKSKAITELSNMRFNGSVQFAGKTLFFNEHGIFEYFGATDNSEQPIPLSLKTGALNFGTQHLKLIPTSKVYVLANKQDGDLGLNVTVDDVTYGYLNSLQYDHFKTYRFGIGRGLRGNYWQFEILGSDVSRLMIDSIELEPQEIRRRA